METAVSPWIVLYVHLHCTESAWKEGTTRVSQHMRIYAQPAGESVVSRISRNANPADAETAACSESDPRATHARPWSLETSKPPGKQASPGPDAHAHKCPRDSYSQHAILQ